MCYVLHADRDSKAAMAKSGNYAYKRWVFTINNPTFDDYVHVIETCTLENCHFAIVGEEKGEKGTPHLQGFVSLRKKVRAGALEESLGGRAWLCQARGSDEENEEYCSKESCYLRIGEPRVQGRSGQLDAATSAVLEGQPMIEIARKYPKAYVMWGRGLERLRMITGEQERNWKTDVIVLVGPPGCGKSKFAHEFPAEKKYYKPRGKWWDGYCGDDVVVLDDFYGWIPYDDLLRACDRYPFRVEYKGGMSQLVAKHIIITSNKEANEWYKCETDHSALYRRITKYYRWNVDKFEEAPACTLPYPINY